MAMRRLGTAHAHAGKPVPCKQLHTSFVFRHRVDTDMGNGGRDLLKAAKPTWTAEDSVRHQLTLIDGASLERSGRYFQHTGEVKEW